MCKLAVSVVFLISGYLSQCQTYAFKNGYWYIDKKFVSKTVYTTNGVFSFRKPPQTDSIIDLQQGYCIPPFGDAHTHNLDGPWNLAPMIKQYLQEGVFYVQVAGNHGKGAQAARPVLAKLNVLEASYANGLLTATYGHGFYPYEPLAMGIYSPRDQIKYADSIKKSRRVENDAYYFLDSIADVDKKWPLIKQYQPDFLKICLLDAENYATKRSAEKVESYGLSPEVAAYVVKKAHAENLRVIAHVETANDARLCAKMGVDALAHLPGYAWNGKPETAATYCMTEADANLFRRSGITVIPTLNHDYTVEFDSAGNMKTFPERLAATIQYEKKALQALLAAKVPIAIGADDFGKTVSKEADYIIKQQLVDNSTLLDIYCRQTPQHIFPRRKLGLIKENYEASFLVLNENPLQQINTIHTGIRLRVKQGRLLKLAE